jgi:hypothetical protein
MQITVPDSSPGDNKKVQEITGRIERGKGRGYRELRGSIQEQSMNLDGQRRVHLEIVRMICQQDCDGRARHYPHMIARKQLYLREP